MASAGPPYFSSLSHKWHDLQEKVIEHKMCVLVFSIIFIQNISHSQKNSARYCHNCENVSVVINEQWSGMPPYIGVEWVWVEYAVCSRGPIQLRRTWRRLYGEQRNLLEGGWCSVAVEETGGWAPPPGSSTSTRHIGLPPAHSFLLLTVWSDILNKETCFKCTFFFLRTTGKCNDSIESYSI
jgi:hypothetical protein